MSSRLVLTREKAQVGADRKRRDGRAPAAGRSAAR